MTDDEIERLAAAIWRRLEAGRNTPPARYLDTAAAAVDLGFETRSGIRESGIKPAGKGRWSVRVARRAARTGRTVNRKATVTGSKADAIRMRDELRADLASTAARPRRMRLSEFAASWLEQQAASLKPGTIRRYGFALAHILPVLGEIYLDGLTTADVSRYIAARVAAVGVKGGHSVWSELRLLRTLAADAVNEGLSERDWSARVKAPKVRTYTRERPNLLTAPQFNALMAHVAPQWLGLLLFMATTGLRMGEASALHWQDVDFATGEAAIRWSNYRGRLVEPKGSNRVVPVLPEVAELWGLRRATGLVFPSRRGGLYRGAPLAKVLDKACAAAGVPRVTSHGLRRTFNNLARQQTSREVLKSITGHRARHRRDGGALLDSLDGREDPGEPGGGEVDRSGRGEGGEGNWIAEDVAATFACDLSSPQPPGRATMRDDKSRKDETYGARWHDPAPSASAVSASVTRPSTRDGSSARASSISRPEVALSTKRQHSSRVASA